MFNIEFFTTKHIIKLSKRIFGQTVLYGFSPNKLDIHYIRTRVLPIHQFGFACVPTNLFYGYPSTPPPLQTREFQRNAVFPLFSTLILPYNTARYPAPLSVPARDIQYFEPQRCSISIFTIDTYAAHDRSDKIMYIIVFSFFTRFPPAVFVRVNKVRITENTVKNHSYFWTGGGRRERGHSVFIPYGTLSTYPYPVLFHIL